MPQKKSASATPRACALCKQRRIKCSRTVPCLHCLRAGAPCVPPAPKPRRRRFAERALLDRLRHYEALLRQNRIAFEPLHGAGKADEDGEDGYQDGDDHDRGTTAATGAHQTRRRDNHDVLDVWQTIKRVALDGNESDFQDSATNNNDGESDASSIASSTSSYERPHPRVRAAVLPHDHLLFGAPVSDDNSIAGHPPPAHLFKLWQVYLDNVDPLLKVTHTPSLQPRIVDAAAAGDLTTLPPAFSALLFSIYCTAILSLAEDECAAAFPQETKGRDALLSSYQSACKQALLQCTPWRVNDRDALTAMHLYLVSLGTQVDPRSLAGMSAVALRTAQRMGMHCEASYRGRSSGGGAGTSTSTVPATTALPPLEAEMRRRLWWSMVMFDHRLCEIASQEKATSLTPYWDCRPPRSLSDFELQAEACSSEKYADQELDDIGDGDGPAKEHLHSPSPPSEALFTVVRGELVDHIRHTNVHRIIAGCSAGQQQTPTADGTAAGSELDSIETSVDTKRLSACREEMPLHYMTLWTARGFLARCRLMEHYLTHATTSVAVTAATTTTTASTAAQGSSPSKPFRPTDAQRRVAIGYALRMLESDTKLRSNPAVRGFLWLVESWSSPVLAYFHVLHGLARRPDAEYADEAWQAMCANYEALANGPKHLRTRLMFALKFSRVTVQAWEAREAMLVQNKLSEEPVPRLVVDARTNVQKVNRMTQMISNQLEQTGQMGQNNQQGQIGLMGQFAQFNQMAPDMTPLSPFTRAQKTTTSRLSPQSSIIDTSAGLAPSLSLGGAASSSANSPTPSSIPFQFPVPFDFGSPQGAGSGGGEDAVLGEELPDFSAFPIPAGFPAGIVAGVPGMTGLSGMSGIASQGSMDMGMGQFWTEEAFKWM